MVEKNKIQENTLSNFTNSAEDTVCPYQPVAENSTWQFTEELNHRVRYAWDDKLKGRILGSYYIGYTISQIPGAWAGKKYGYIKLLTMSFFAAGLLTSLLPCVLLKLRDSAAAKFFVIIRFLIGLLQGCCFPILIALWGSWAPSSELSRLVSIQFAGAGIGIAVMYPINGWLAGEFDWQSIFYVSGIISMIFSVALGYFCSDTPGKD